MYGLFRLEAQLHTVTNFYQSKYLYLNNLLNCVLSCDSIQSLVSLKDTNVKSRRENHLAGCCRMVRSLDVPFQDSADSLSRRDKLRFPNERGPSRP